MIILPYWEFKVHDMQEVLFLAPSGAEETVLISAGKSLYTHVPECSGLFVVSLRVKRNIVPFIACVQMGKLRRGVFTRSS